MSAVCFSKFWQARGVSFLAKMVGLKIGDLADAEGRFHVELEVISNWAAVPFEPIWGAIEELNTCGLIKSSYRLKSGRPATLGVVLDFSAADALEPITYKKQAITETLRARVISEYGDHCYYCGAEGRIVIDHVIPEARGGPTIFANLVPACSPCNTSKGNRTPDEWRNARLAVNTPGAAR